MLSLRDTAIEIWKAGVAAVDSEKLVFDHVDRTAGLSICGNAVDVGASGRLVVVGGGKAAAGMGAGFEAALQGSPWMERLEGWLNVPEDCLRPLERIHLHPARPAGINEPTEAGVIGSQTILERVAALDESDVCVVLLSGGGSALLPCPVDGVTLDEKRNVTRLLSTRGATINELNAVRTRLSKIKGGGLARACRAGTMIVMIISDVIGDPLDVIASGPTVISEGDGPDAWEIFRKFADETEVAPATVAALRDAAHRREPERLPRIEHAVIGNIHTAIAAAAEAAARRFGLQVIRGERELTGPAREAGRALAERLESLAGDRDDQGRICLVTGGETTVDLSDSANPGRGGRNQELALAAVARWWKKPPTAEMVLLSGGTDGEDGPTDAAGGIADAVTIAGARQLGWEPFDFLARHDAYPFLEGTGSLLKTGPTHTNVMDLQVGVIDPARPWQV